MFKYHVIPMFSDVIPMLDHRLYARPTPTLTALKYVCISHGDQRVFQFEIIINVLVSSFRFT